MSVKPPTTLPTVEHIVITQAPKKLDEDSARQIWNVFFNNFLPLLTEAHNFTINDSPRELIQTIYAGEFERDFLSQIFDPNSLNTLELLKPKIDFKEAISLNLFLRKTKEYNLLDTSLLSIFETSKESENGLSFQEFEKLMAIFQKTSFGNKCFADILSSHSLFPDGLSFREGLSFTLTWLCDSCISDLPTNPFPNFSVGILGLSDNYDEKAYFTTFVNQFDRFKKTHEKSLKQDDLEELEFVIKRLEKIIPLLRLPLKSLFQFVNFQPESIDLTTDCGDNCDLKKDFLYSTLLNCSVVLEGSSCEIKTKGHKKFKDLSNIFLEKATNLISNLRNSEDPRRRVIDNFLRPNKAQQFVRYISEEYCKAKQLVRFVTSFEIYSCKKIKDICIKQTEDDSYLSDLEIFQIYSSLKHTISLLQKYENRMTQIDPQIWSLFRVILTERKLTRAGDNWFGNKYISNNADPFFIQEELEHPEFFKNEFQAFKDKCVLSTISLSGMEGLRKISLSMLKLLDPVLKVAFPNIERKSPSFEELFNEAWMEEEILPEFEDARSPKIDKIDNEVLDIKPTEVDDDISIQALIEKTKHLQISDLQDIQSVNFYFGSQVQASLANLKTKRRNNEIETHLHQALNNFIHYKNLLLANEQSSAAIALKFFYLDLHVYLENLFSTDIKPGKTKDQASTHKLDALLTLSNFENSRELDNYLKKINLANIWMRYPGRQESQSSEPTKHINKILDELDDQSKSAHIEQTLEDLKKALQILPGLDENFFSFFSKILEVDTTTFLNLANPSTPKSHETPYSLKKIQQLQKVFETISDLPKNKKIAIHISNCKAYLKDLETLINLCQKNPKYSFSFLHIRAMQQLENVIESLFEILHHDNFGHELNSHDFSKHLEATPHDELKKLEKEFQRINLGNSKHYFFNPCPGKISELSTIYKKHILFETQLNQAGGEDFQVPHAIKKPDLEKAFAIMHSMLGLLDEMIPLLESHFEQRSFMDERSISYDINLSIKV